jgi:antitoxin YefM
VKKITEMIAANYSEFRTDLKKYLDSVEDNNETLIIKRKTGKGAVVISLDEYNSMMETLHLLSSKKNADRLYESIQQLRSGKTRRPELGD